MNSTELLFAVITVLIAAASFYLTLLKPKMRVIPPDSINNDFGEDWSNNQFNLNTCYGNFKVRNQGLGGGYISRVEIVPKEFYPNVEIRVIDFTRERLGFYKTSDIKFTFLLVIPKAMQKIVPLEFNFYAYDNNGKMVWTKKGLTPLKIRFDIEGKNGTQTYQQA